ncbi:hypothetical protein TNCV_4868871 [Trichonephila clavipes]|nr:hypothetical protein TNCV_4868871 [Trichonephila clavipes]
MMPHSCSNEVRSGDLAGQRSGIGGVEDDIEDELTIELQDILNEEHQETQRNVSPSEQEETKEDQCRHLPLKIFLKSGMLSEQWS